MSTHPFVLLDYFSNLCKTLIIQPIDAPKASNRITSLESCLVGWAPSDHTVDLREWRLKRTRANSRASWQ
jgi:hypothetical protein